MSINPRASRIKDLLIASSLLGLVAAFWWLGWVWQQHRHKANLAQENMKFVAKATEAVAKLEALGADCRYYPHDIRLKEKQFDHGTIKAEVLVALRELSSLGRQICLQLDNTPISDEGMAAIKQIPGITHLELSGTKVSDLGLRHLEGNTEMHRLTLESWYPEPEEPRDITDSGLRSLRGMANLNRLGLSFSRITDSGLENLQDLTRMEVLFLNGTRIRGPGLVHLQKMERLKWLFVGTTLLDDAGLEHLPLLPNLEMLHIQHTKVTDRGLKHVAKLPRLRALRLHGVNVSDVGIRELAKVKTLRHLELSADANVTQEALDELKKAFPKLNQLPEPWGK